MSKGLIAPIGNGLQFSILVHARKLFGEANDLLLQAAYNTPCGSSFARAAERGHARVSDHGTGDLPVIRPQFHSLACISDYIAFTNCLKC